MLCLSRNLRKRILVLFVLGVAGATLFAASADKGSQGPSGLPFSYFRGEPLRIGNQTQLLADDYVVEDRWKLVRTVGQAFKSLRNPVVVQDKPWEGTIGPYPSVLYDDRTHKFRMWYQCFNLTNYFTHDGPNYYVAYAESEDGFDWKKPLLEGFPFGQYPRTNVVMTGRGGRRASGMQVFLNPDQSDPQKRFMMVYTAQTVDLAYSPDGLHWNIVEKPLLQYKTDFPNHLLWIPENKLWYLYVRPAVRANGRGPLPEGLRHTGRRLAVTISNDLTNFEIPRTVLYPDERDEPDYDNAVVFRRYGVFLALYSEMYQEHGGSETDMHVAISRDGIHWERTWNRKPLVARGPDGTYDHGIVEPGTTPPIDVGEDMFIYYSASPFGQAQWAAEGGIAACRLRKDRFIGQVAGEDTGYLLTRQFVLEGTKLRFNCSALPIPYFKESDGIRVAILEAPDYQSKQTMFERAVPGFGLQDCDPIVTDNTAHTVTWHGKSDLSALRGKAIYLRIEMKNAALYSFQIAP
jgi:hypothetical protein